MCDVGIRAHVGAAREQSWIVLNENPVFFFICPWGFLRALYMRERCELSRQKSFISVTMWFVEVVS